MRGMRLDLPLDARKFAFKQAITDHFSIFSEREKEREELSETERAP